MEIIAYVLSIIIFILAELIVPTFVLVLYALFTRLYFLVTKHRVQPYSLAAQFLGNFFGTLLGILIALYSFNWFNIQPYYYILIAFFTLFSLWLKPNAVIDSRNHPKAQRLGVILGATTIFLFYLLYFRIHAL